MKCTHNIHNIHHPNMDPQEVFFSQNLEDPCVPIQRLAVAGSQEIPPSSLAQSQGHRCDKGDRVPLGQAFCEARAQGAGQLPWWEG